MRFRYRLRLPEPGPVTQVIAVTLGLLAIAATCATVVLLTRLLDRYLG